MSGKITLLRFAPGCAPHPSLRRGAIRVEETLTAADGFVIERDEFGGFVVAHPDSPTKRHLVGASSVRFVEETLPSPPPASASKGKREG